MNGKFDDDHHVAIVDVNPKNVFNAIPYSRMYSQHPGHLVATRAGLWKTVRFGSDPYTGKSSLVMLGIIQKTMLQTAERVSTQNT